MVKTYINLSLLDEKTKENIKKQAEEELAKEGITPDNLVYKILLQLKINDIMLSYGKAENPSQKH